MTEVNCSPKKGEAFESLSLNSRLDDVKKLSVCLKLSNCISILIYTTFLLNFCDSEGLPGVVNSDSIVLYIPNFSLILRLVIGIIIVYCKYWPVISV